MFEVFVGVCLIAGRLMRIVLPLLVLQMAGTFLVLVMHPDVAFRDGNPLLLTVEGEFVIKNLVLLSAASRDRLPSRADRRGRHGQRLSRRTS